MKLHNKTQIYYSTLFLVILMIWSGIFLFIVSEVLKEDIDETLQTELESTLELLETKFPNSIQDYAEINPLFDFKHITSVQTKDFIYTDTTVFSALEQENIPYRRISVEKEWFSKPIRISLRKSTIEYKDLFITILLTESFLVLLLIIGVYWMNRRIFKSTWKPFYTSLEAASAYNLSGNKSLQLSNSTTDEFNTLNEVLQKMTLRIENDYKNLKEFTENASHEIQTPLSVILNRIEVLMQEDQFSPEQWESIKDIYQSATHLSRLNKGLLLLTKIENNQFEGSEKIDLSNLLKNILNQFSEEIDQMSIELKEQIPIGIWIRANPELIEILIRNLITNSIKHNIKNGNLKIILTNTYLNIVNKGLAPIKNPEIFFERFSKENSASSSLGLGLAIVKQICTLSGFLCTYTYENSLHKVIIQFGSE